MSAAETIARATEKLEAQRAASTPGEWVIHNMAEDPDTDADWWWVWAKDRLPYYGGVLELDGKEDWGFRATVGGAAITDNRDPAKEKCDGELIVTLHRTIDAQLGMLRGVLRVHQEVVGLDFDNEEVWPIPAWALKLAEAILGGDR